MGWFWNAARPADASASSSINDSASPFSTAPSQPSPLPPPRSSPPTSASQQQPHNADQSIDDFLTSFEATTLPTRQTPPPSLQPPPSQTPTPPLPTPPPQRALPSDTTTPSPPLDLPPLLPPLATRILPTSMSCRSAFDTAYHCSSPGGRLTSIYRHGEVRACSELWSDFWFCMRVKGYGDEGRAAATREHYHHKEYERYYAPGKPSSEDVWEEREEKVELGRAFEMEFSKGVVGKESSLMG